ncbi:MAG TPA: ATP-binding protein [Trebonia sp.]|nr:ATP-binding protein [Trebonia sp.]
MTQDAEREYRPSTAAPVPVRPPTTPLPVGQPTAEPVPPAQTAAGQRNGSWFEPRWGQPGQPGAAPPGNAPYGQGEQGSPAQYGRSDQGTSLYGSAQSGTNSYIGQPGQFGAGQYGAAQPAAGQYGTRQSANGVAVAAPAQPPVPVTPPAPVRPAAPVSWPELVPAVVPADPSLGEQAALPASAAWPDICDQFGLHLLVLAEQLRTSLDELEADEDDPDRLKRLYQVDHAVTRMRRASRDLRTLAGRSEEELAGFTTSLLDVIRMAASAIERYTQVTIGRVTELAVLGYAADDIGSVMAALLDNATRYSPGAVTVSCHLLEDGGVMFRIEDTGIGIGADQVAVLNAAFAAPVPDVDERTGRHTGFPVVHRIARKHSLGVRLAARPLPSSGTVAMVMLPPHLLCEVPAEEAQRRPAPATPASQQTPPRPSAVDLPRGEPTRAHPLPQWAPPELPDREASLDADQEQEPVSGDLPRRERASLRGDEPRPEKQAPGMVPTAEQQAAARRAFADDLSAFSRGTGGSAVFADPKAAGDGEEDDDDAETTATTATEEQANS